MEKKVNYVSLSTGEELIDLRHDTITKEVLVKGYTAHNSEGEPIEGAMTNNEAIEITIDGINTTSCSIPEGYHNGNGKVSLTDDIENEVDSQSEIIAQIKSALQGKAVGNKEEQKKSVIITENGKHSITPDEGYTLYGVDIDVAVPIGDPYEVINSIINGTITEFYTLEIFNRNTKSLGNIFNDCYDLVKWAMPNNTFDIGSYCFRYCNKLKYIDIGSPTECHQALFYGRPLKGMTIVIRAETPPKLTSAFIGTGFDNTTKIFVPKNSLEAYKTATNWSTYADCFYAIEDYPEEVNYDNY